MLDPTIRLPLNERFHLRAIRFEDAAAWYAYLSLPEVYRLTAWNLEGVEDLQVMMRHYASEESGAPIRFAIVRCGDDALVGTVGFHSLSLGNHSAELAYDLSPALQGQGLATLAARTAIRWMVTSRGFNRIQATALSENLPSIRVLERCGMRFEGLLRQFRNVRGELRDYRMFSLLAEEVLAAQWGR